MIRCGTLAQLVREAGARFAAAAVHFPPSSGRRTLAELAAEATAVACGLHRAGVRAGDPVAIMLPTSPDFLAALFGVFRAGAVAVPVAPRGFLDPTAFSDRLHRVLADGEIRFLIAAPGESFPPAAALTVPGLLNAGPGVPLPEPRPDDLAIVQYTSGSTSSPKGVCLTNANVMAGLWAIVAGSGVSGADVNAQWAPLHHDMGLFEVLSCAACGAEQHLWAPSAFARDPGRWLSGFAAVRGTMCAMPSGAFAALTEGVSAAAAAALDLSAWRVAYNGSEPVSAAQLRAFQDRFAAAGFRREAMFPVYGLAEATLAVTFPELGSAPHTEVVDADALADGRAIPCRPGRRAREVVGLGRAVPGVEVRVAREGRGAPDDQVGEIQVRGAPVTRGYYRNPEATARAFDGDWLRTGDLGFTRGGRLFICGRQKDLVIVNGTKYHPEDVEEVVRRVPGVHRGRCVAVPLADDPGERVVVVVEARGDPGALAETIRARVASEVGLARVEVVLVRPGEIPRTTSGKVMRSRVRDRLAGGPGAGGS